MKKEIKLLSIVIPYYNRRQLLINTLRSIACYKRDYPIEVIIVDDGSDREHQIDDIGSLIPLTIKLLVLERKEAKWRGPTVAYNIGFSQVKGDVVLINSSECYHNGDILHYIFNRIEDGMYISFSAYMGNLELTKKIEEGIHRFTTNVKGATYWGSHSSNYTLIPYCATICTKDLEQLSGYDERFAFGVGYDDYDFTDRIKNLGLNTRLVDDPFVIHQWHQPTVYPNKVNINLLFSLREKEPNRVKVKTNKIYLK
jgi:glycosyltransferase involved in cell wall biosynthesis